MSAMFYRSKPNSRPDSVQSMGKETPPLDGNICKVTQQREVGIEEAQAIREHYFNNYKSPKSKVQMLEPRDQNRIPDFPSKPHPTEPVISNQPKSSGDSDTQCC